MYSVCGGSARYVQAAPLARPTNLKLPLPRETGCHCWFVPPPNCQIWMGVPLPVPKLVASQASAGAPRLTTLKKPLSVGLLVAASPPLHRVLFVSLDEVLLRGHAKAVVERHDNAVVVGQARGVSRRHPGIDRQPTAQINAPQRDCVTVCVHDIESAGMKHGEGLGAGSLSGASEEQ